MGYNAASFYVDWALLEGQPGVLRDTGIFSLEPFFEAASQAGIYLLAVGSNPASLVHKLSVVVAAGALYQR